MNPKDNTLLFEMADKLDIIEARQTKIEARLVAVETRINKLESYFFKEQQKQSLVGKGKKE